MADEIQFTRFSKSLQLREMECGYYGLVLKYLRELWLPELHLASDIAVDADVAFLGDVRSFSHIWIRRQRYGTANSHRGRLAQHAYIDGRNPVVIQYILRATQQRENAPPLVANFAVVQRFQSGPDIPVFPWEMWYVTSLFHLTNPDKTESHHRAVDLGVQSWIAHHFGPKEIVSLDRLTGQFILAPITVRGIDIWVTVAYDHVSNIYSVT